MRKRLTLLMLLVLLALVLTGCSYWVVEDTPVQVGSADRAIELPLLE